MKSLKWGNNPRDRTKSIIGARGKTNPDLPALLVQVGKGPKNAIHRGDACARADMLMRGVLNSEQAMPACLERARQIRNSTTRRKLGNMATLFLCP